MKKRILSFLLALLMVVSIFPAPAYATDSTDVTITPTETTETSCPTCGTVGCTSEHLNWCSDCQKDNCGQNHCDTCGAIDCTTEHKICDKCGTLDCTADHTNWCADCKVDNCGQNHCPTCRAIDCTKEHKACETCSVIDCTADHTNWCNICKVDNCGKTHVYCETCQKYDCGENHNATEPTEPATESVAPIDEGNEEEKHPMMGKYVKLTNGGTPWGYVTYPNWSNVIVTVYPAFMEVSDVLEKDGVTYYRLKAAPNYVWSSSNPQSDDTVYLESTKLTEVTWCADCQKYDCGTDHTATEPSIPENPCGCCDGCTGAESCTCQCGNCNFCEKPEEPTVPSISTIVNGQTVTVTGDALPEGTSLKITSNLIEKYDVYTETEYDISLVLGGQKYEPDFPVQVTISGLDVASNSYVRITHYLEDEELITKYAGTDSVVLVEDAELAAKYPAAAKAAYNALGKTNTVCLELLLSSDGTVHVSNGSITYSPKGFSINVIASTGYDASLGYHYAVYDDDNGTPVNSNGYADNHEITMDNHDGEIYWVTRGQRVYIDSGYYSIQGSYSGDYKDWTQSSNRKENYHILYFTVNSNAEFYKKHSVRMQSDKGWGDPGGDYTIYFYVVPEVQIYFNANLPAGANGSGITIPASKKTVLGMGTQNIPYSRTYVSPPSGAPTGYTFNGWYTKADGGTPVSSGTYVYLRQEDATFVGGTNNDQYRMDLYAHWKANNYTVKFHANGGSGTMSDQSMTYGKAADLSANQFTRTGHVFLGWSRDANATAATYTDSQSVSNLTATDNDVVNLYAVWVDVMAITDMRIGINESYFFTNYTYTVTADGVSTQSYHAYPNEPAVQSIRYMRPTDKSGSWQIVQNDTLAGSAHNYIDPAILNSDFFVRSYKADQNVWGVADPSGSKTRQFFKIGSEDQQKIIKAWLQSMANRTEATPNDDGTYNIDSWGSTYKTDVNWKNEVDKGADYEIIPYVIKLENNNAWRIDMVIAPKTHVTLSYDLNINTDAGYVLSGGSSIPSAQYPRGSEQNVLGSPTAYNPYIKVTKPGTDYVAKFLYWEDEQGKKYGNGNATTITMDSSKSLKAIWEYTDQTQGSLKVEKEVTVPADSGLTPDTSKSFTINVALNKNGTYPYTKYSTTGIATESGSFTGTTKSFSLKSDEYVIITGINQGITYTVSETAPTGYTNKSGTITGTIQAGNTKPATIVNENSSYTESFDFNGGSNTNTSVTVVYGSTNYFDVSWLKPTRTGHKFLGWFTAKEGGTQVYTDEGICIDGAYWSSKKWIGTANLPLYAQWEEETYTVTFVDDDGTTILSEAKYAYGTAADDIVKPADPSKDDTDQYTYTFAGWTPAVTAVTGEAIYKAKYTETLQTYTVTASIDDGGEIVGTNPQTVGYGNEATVVFRPKDGYEIASITVNGENITDFDPTGGQITRIITCNTTVEITTVLSEFTVTWVDGDGKTLYSEKVKSGVTPVYSGATPTKTATAQYTYTWDRANPWSPTVVAVTGDATYTARFTSTVNKYTITWVDGNGSTLKTEQVEYGGMPAYTDAAPTKMATVSHTFTWNTAAPWSPTVVAVTGDATYTAQFTSADRLYTITWVDGNDSTLKTEQVAYGSMPAYTGATPTKTWTDEFAYTFNNTWTPAIKTVTGDETYIAQFDPTTRKYTVTWWQDKNENGVMDEATELLHTDSDVPYNTMLKYDGTEPTKEPNQQYWYNFAGWEKTDESTFNAYDEIAVTGDMTFKAILNPTLMKYYVTWLVEGVEKDKDLWKYGDFPSYSGETPTKAEDDGYTYEWKGEWTPVVSRVVDTVIYSAVFEKTERVFTISYDLTDDDGRTGTVNGTNPVEYTVEDITITLINPTAAQPYYKFAGWTGTDLTDKTMTVTIPTGSTGNRAYHANYELIEYQISFDTNGADGATLAPVTYRYGDNVTLPTVSREGYTYKWKVHEAEGDWTGVTGEVTSGVMNHYGDMVLKAEWTANSYEIRFNQNADDAKGTMANLEMTYDVAEKLTANDFQYTGYTFLGWTDDPDSTQVLYEDQEEVRNLTDKENGVVDLYAVWEINTVSLTIRTSSLDTNQSYVFQVEGTGLDGTGIDLKVILDANDSQTIVDLPAGTYTIRNEQGWSWRYEVKSETKDVHAATVVAEFSNWQNTAKIYWLNGYGNQQIKRKQNSN